jgi:hypothetical protein
MSIDSPFDPRTALVRTKYFNQYPQPLERWLWKQGLPQAAERVFWLHWTEGKRNGDWCSEIPIKRVAFECCVDISTVTRSYQALKTLGLLRREDPGRDPRNPFCQATAITEVRLPRQFLTELSRSPNRPLREAISGDTCRTSPVAGGQAVAGVIPIAVEPPPATAAAAVAQETVTSLASDSTLPAPRPNRQASQAMWGRASDAEKTRFFQASRDRLTVMEFDPDTRLTPEDRGQILAQLTQLASARPTMATTAAPKAAKGPYVAPRRLTVLDLARTRKRVLETVPGSGAPEILRQVIWAVEHGALRRFDMTMALNIALKKIREGAWSKPNRMPPNWLPPARERECAVPEQCSIA